VVVVRLSRQALSFFPQVERNAPDVPTISMSVSQQAAGVLNKYISENAVIGDPREEVTDYIRTREFTPNTMLALRQLVGDIGNETVLFGELAKVPNDRVRNFPNDMYLASEALRMMQKSHQPDISAGDWAILTKIDELQKARRRQYAIHSRMGKSRGGYGSWIRHHGGLEKNRGDRRRKDW
jgi:hypothetical protein